jgi:tRNA(Ile)-lysidine synthase
MYHLIEICEKKEVLYSYVLERLELMNTEYFTISDDGKSTEAVTLSEDDFPVVVRNARNGDAISLRFGTKKLSRWFIDRKIPKDERRRWPVMVNRHGEIVLVPGIGCDCEHYSNTPTCFMVK